MEQVAGQVQDDAASLGRRLVTEVLEPLKRAFVGKDQIVDLIGVALVSGENLFLLGPPGTAKSALIFELGRRISGRTFEYLLTRFTEPNELFGPFDIRRLREGDLVTNTEGMLPEASLVFLDELLNANSAILNSLLMVLNERVFRRGREMRPLPTLAVFAASNRLPEDDALGALFDRFLLRATCENVPGDRLMDVLHAGWNLDQKNRNGQPAVDAAATFDVEDIRKLNRLLGGVDLSAIWTPLASLVLRLRNAGVAFSDRRAVKMQRLTAASALLSGRSAARPTDLWVFRHVWDTLEQQEVLNALVQEALRQEPSDAEDHPRAAESAPNSEELARDLNGLDALVKKTNAAGPERATIKDRLTLLASRVQWVADQDQRQFLQFRVDRLWKALAGEEAPA
jgi:MoxR-like ATPase